MAGLLDEVNKAVSKIQESAKSVLDKTDIDEKIVEAAKDLKEKAQAALDIFIDYRDQGVVGDTVIFSVGSFETDLNTAVGPLASAPWAGEQPSASGSCARLPSGVAMVPMPWPTLAEMEEVPP